MQLWKQTESIAEIDFSLNTRQCSGQIGVSTVWIQHTVRARLRTQRTIHKSANRFADEKKRASKLQISLSFSLALSGNKTQMGVRLFQI